jgi:hypothetical protein
MEKQKGKNEALFTSRLDDGEEILWLGQSQNHEVGTLKELNDIPVRKQIAVSLLMAFVVAGLSAFGLSSCFALLSMPGAGNVIFGSAVLTLLALVLYFFLKPHLSTTDRKNYYAISTKRIFLDEEGLLNSYSLARFIKITQAYSNPPSGLVDIAFYTDNEKLIQPIFRFKWLDAEEAEIAYKTLQDAREKAIESHAGEMEEKKMLDAKNRAPRY